MVMDVTENFEALDDEIFTKYAGKWIAAINGKVVVSGDSFNEVNEIAERKYPGKEPLFGKLAERKLISMSL